MSSSFIALKDEKAAYYTSSFPIMSDLLFKICRARTKANCGRLKVTHSESRSHPKNRLCCGRSVHVLAIESARAQLSTTRLQRRVNLRIVSFMHNMFFRSRRSNTLELDILKPARKNCSSCSRRKSFVI